MAIALGYLYSYQASKMLSPANARATLASACLLGGMEELCAKAYTICKESIRVDTIEEWLAWADAHQALHPSSALNGHSPNTSAPSTPRSPSSPSPLSAQERQVSAGPSIFGPYAQMLRDDALEFLIVSLPAILIADTNESDKSEIGGEALEALLRVFSRVSFDSKFVNMDTIV
jgi:hypothetical protein